MANIKNKWTLSLLVLIGAILFIEITSFYQLGVYVDEQGTSPSVVLGGDFWVYMKWLKLFLLLGIVTALFLKLSQKK